MWLVTVVEHHQLLDLVAGLEADGFCLRCAEREVRELNGSIVDTVDGKNPAITS